MGALRNRPIQLVPPPTRAPATGTLDDLPAPPTGSSPVVWPQQYRDFKRIMQTWSPIERLSLIKSKARYGMQGVRMLGYALKVERDPRIREEAVVSLAVAGGPAEAPRILRYARHGTEAERRGAFRGLLILVQNHGPGPLYPRAKDPAWAFLQTVKATAHFASGWAFEAASAVLGPSTADPRVRTAAAAFMEGAVSAFVSQLRDASDPVERLSLGSSLRTGVAQLQQTVEDASLPLGPRVASGRALTAVIAALQRTTEHALRPLTVEEVSAQEMALDLVVRADPALARALAAAARRRA